MVQPQKPHTHTKATEATKPGWNTLNKKNSPQKKPSHLNYDKWCLFGSILFRAASCTYPTLSPEWDALNRGLVIPCRWKNGYNDRCICIITVYSNSRKNVNPYFRDGILISYIVSFVEWFSHSFQASNFSTFLLVAVPQPIWVQISPPQLLRGSISPYAFCMLGHAAEHEELRGAIVACQLQICPCLWDMKHHQTLFWSCPLWIYCFINL